MRIIYFDIDTLRADHLGCYGYNRNTSPTIDKIAEDGVKFTRCYTSDSPCLPSRAALFSGRFGINNGITGNDTRFDVFMPYHFHNLKSPLLSRQVRNTGMNNTEMPMLMRQLRKNGIKTISFSNFADRHGAMWFHNGFTEFHTFSLQGGSERSNEVNEYLIPWLKKNCAEDNYFLHINYWDPHAPYRIKGIKKWIDMIKDTPAPAWPDEDTIKYHYENIYGPRTSRDLYTTYAASGYESDYKRPYPNMPDEIKTREDFKMLIDSYDASIRFNDYHINQVLEVLKEKGVLDDAILIISGDHGDSFGENGHYMDHSLANEPVLKRPLIIKWPGITKDSKCDEFVYQLDLAPTLCEMLNISIPSKWDGKSFADAVKGKDFKGWDYLVCGHGIYTLQRAVRSKDYLMVKTYHPGLYPIDEPYWLFDMKKDPHMTRNIASEKPDVLEKHKKMLEEWKKEQQPKHEPDPDPMEYRTKYGEFQYFTPEQMIERLKKTGREDKIEELKKRLKKYNPDLKL